MVGADVSIVVLLFGKTIFVLLASVWRRRGWAFVFIIIAFYRTKSITKLIVLIKSFVNTDVVLQAASSGLFLTTFDLVFGTFDRANTFTTITIGVKIVTFD